MTRRESVPRWLVAAGLIALAANLLATAMTQVTVGLMRSLTPFAEAVRAHDLEVLRYYQAVVYVGATALIVRYLHPIIRHFRRDADEPATPLVQRHTVNAPLVVAGIGFLPWLVSAIVFPLFTLAHFGRWSPELSSQQIFSPLVNGFLAATTTYLLLDWLFRAMVVPRVFPDGRLAEVPGSLALGVRARLLVFLLAVAFTPLFTVLGLIRAAAARIAAGRGYEQVLPALIEASQATFVIYVGLGIGFTLLLARTFTEPLAAVAATLRRLQRGELDTRLQPRSSDEVGVLEDGVNAMAAALQDRQRILQTFGRVVDPAVRDHLLDGELHLGGEVRTATVLFCDLRGFTAAAERMTPQEVVGTLNEFFSLMAAWVRECGGFVDKFMGDAMLVVFGLFGSAEDAPRAAADAIRCALGMPERLTALNWRRHAEGQWPLAISIGVDSGPVLAGTIGAEDRLEYTVIGDAVNVASRLQSVGKERGTAVLVSEATVALARQAGAEPPLAALDTVPLRGRHAAVRVYGAAA
jgi:adenylate cyclase